MVVGVGGGGGCVDEMKIKATELLSLYYTLGLQFIYT